MTDYARKYKKGKVLDAPATPTPAAAPAKSSAVDSDALDQTAQEKSASDRKHHHPKHTSRHQRNDEPRSSRHRHSHHRSERDDGRHSRRSSRPAEEDRHKRRSRTKDDDHERHYIDYATSPAKPDRQPRTNRPDHEARRKEREQNRLSRTSSVAESATDAPSDTRTLSAMAEEGDGAQTPKAPQSSGQDTPKSASLLVSILPASLFGSGVNVDDEPTSQAAKQPVATPHEADQSISGTEDDSRSLVTANDGGNTDDDEHAAQPFAADEKTASGNTDRSAPDAEDGPSKDSKHVRMAETAAAGTATGIAIKKHHRSKRTSRAEEKPETTATAAASVPPTLPNSGSFSQPKSSYKMTGVDSMLIYMEDKTYAPTCYSVYSFVKPLDRKTVENFLVGLTEAFTKYQYRVVRRNKTFRGPRWERMPSSWSPSQNLREVRLHSGRNGDADLFKRIGDHIAGPFDPSLPPWELMLFQNVNGSDGTVSALGIKVAHYLSDGQGLIQSYHIVLQSMAHQQNIADIKRDIAHHRRPPNKTLGPFSALYPGTIRHMAHGANKLFLAKSRTAFTYKDKKASRATGRLYAHSAGMPLDQIKLIREAFKHTQASLNDVAMAILARAARRTASTEKVATKDKHFCFLVPVSYRPADNWEVANLSTASLAWFDFKDPKVYTIEEQIIQAHHEMNIIKRSNLHSIAFKFFDIFYKVPAFYTPNWRIFKSTYYKIFSQYHVASNLPGPPKPISWMGNEAISYHVLPPSSPGKSTLALGMISYASNFSIAISCDDVPEFRKLPQDFCRAFDDVAREFVSEAKKRLGSLEKSSEKHDEPAIAEPGQKPADITHHVHASDVQTDSQEESDSTQVEPAAPKSEA
ncbi:uncharacterized protein L969DRAFT_83714 [Mixia osmundae IAM 14324]|uniref:O-acyltransferase WSD1 C-terminal domain-containing protein n=1 Tax=Mixia osmundae (strain CBS 9802 / IAM 14324 / JCM 22182 / KY 12970) TaxID=764103 RepID=G7E3R3_MIXOS|nr:uncharacterized protein L969DRAFT_83714 [Mixia osmundae IAM 14324]KEI41867.1 hypothetical protein L969DRAFT_83714 [Mixia osmundae IAM 14324]GAA97473.1 hypothetical protein E5Q_04152 [Mixia osmundae IAM 14324]